MSFRFCFRCHFTSQVILCYIINLSESDAFHITAIFKAFENISLTDKGCSQKSGRKSSKKKLFQVILSASGAKQTYFTLPRHPEFMVPS